MGFGNDIFSAVFNGIAKGSSQGFEAAQTEIKNSRIEEIKIVKETLELINLNFIAVYNHKVKPRKIESFVAYMCDLIRLVGILGNVELCEAVNGIEGNFVQILNKEEAEEQHDNMCALFDIVQEIYDEFKFEAVDLKALFKEEAYNINTLHALNLSNRKMYKFCQNIILEIGIYLNRVISDLDEILNLL